MNGIANHESNLRNHGVFGSNRGSRACYLIALYHYHSLACLMVDVVKIVTHYDPKPIPRRDCDWIAVLDNYEPGDPLGLGATESEAIADLKLIMERDDEDLRYETEANEQFGIGS